MAGLVTTTSLRRGEEIYSSEDPAEQWYCIVSGLARKCAVSAAGRRRIVDFLLPGDFFGFTAREEHVFTVEAVVDGTTVARYPRRRVETIANADPELALLIREAAFEAISRLQARVVMIGRTTARRKVSAFIVEMAQRLSDGSDRVIVLPMSRYDIADYLALAVETVSRAITDLKECGAITVSGKRQITIIDRGALER
jgi:CRP-like cAMP-binding protein